MKCTASLLLLLGVTIFPATILAAMTDDTRQYALDYHNYLRAKVARGEIAGQPQAADMTLLSYDDRLEREAQRHASENCGQQLSHDSYSDRDFKPYVENVGQNIKSCQNAAGSNYVKESMVAWFDEYKMYNYQPISNSNLGTVGHYTAIAWAKTVLVGCGYDKCQGNDLGRFMCNFAESGNRFDNLPYKRGSPCSKCPANEGYTMCMDNSLCATKSQCSKSKGKCRCLVNQGTCSQNGGTFDSGSCKCNCPRGKSGINCEDSCKDGINYCQKYAKYCKNLGSYQGWLDVKCRETCNFCNGPVFVDNNRQNRYNIIPNSKITVNEKKFGKACPGYTCPTPDKKIVCKGESYITVQDGYKYKCTCGGGCESAGLAGGGGGPGGCTPRCKIYGENHCAGSFEISRSGWVYKCNCANSGAWGCNPDRPAK